MVLGARQRRVRYDICHDLGQLTAGRQVAMRSAQGQRQMTRSISGTFESGVMYSSYVCVQYSTSLQISLYQLGFGQFRSDVSYSNRVNFRFQFGVRFPCSLAGSAQQSAQFVSVEIPPPKKNARRTEPFFNHKQVWHLSRLINTSSYRTRGTCQHEYTQ